MRTSTKSSFNRKMLASTHDMASEVSKREAGELMKHIETVSSEPFLNHCDRHKPLIVQGGAVDKKVMLDL